MATQWCSSIGEYEQCADWRVMGVAIIVELAFYFFIGSLGWKLNKLRKNKKKDEKKPENPF